MAKKLTRTMAVNLRWTEALKRAAMKAAKAEGRSLNAYIELAVQARNAQNLKGKN